MHPYRVWYAFSYQQTNAWPFYILQRVTRTWQNESEIIVYTIRNCCYQQLRLLTYETMDPREKDVVRWIVDAATWQRCLFCAKTAGNLKKITVLTNLSTITMISKYAVKLVETFRSIISYTRNRRSTFVLALYGKIFCRSALIFKLLPLGLVVLM